MWVPDNSRIYLNKLGRKYSYNDILTIAKGQQELEQEMEARATGFIFSDTDQIVNKIWCEEKFGTCHQWILETIEQNPYDLYLLCKPDLPWDPDPLRENPNDRDRLFSIYLMELKKRKLPFMIISGKGIQRLNNAITAIEEYFKP